MAQQSVYDRILIRLPVYIGCLGEQKFCAVKALDYQYLHGIAAADRWIHK